MTKVFFTISILLLAPLSFANECEDLIFDQIFESKSQLYENFTMFQELANDAETMGNEKMKRIYQARFSAIYRKAIELVDLACSKVIK